MIAPEPTVEKLEAEIAELVPGIMNMPRAQALQKILDALHERDCLMARAKELRRALEFASQYVCANPKCSDCYKCKPIIEALRNA